MYGMRRDGKRMESPVVAYSLLRTGWTRLWGLFGLVLLLIFSFVTIVSLFLPPVLDQIRQMIWIDHANFLDFDIPLHRKRLAKSNPGSWIHPLLYVGRDNFDRFLSHAQLVLAAILPVVLIEATGICSLEVHDCVPTGVTAPFSGASPRVSRYGTK